MFERYTEQSRRVVFFAHYEAVQRSSARVTTAHLLLGLIREKDSRANIVGSLTAKILDPCELLGIQPRPATQVPFDKKLKPLDDNSKKALTYAAQEADQDHQYWIDTDHLLRALLCFPNEASPALEFIPLDLALVRAASKLHREECPPRRTPFWRVGGIWFEPLKQALLKLAMMAIVGLIAVLVLRWLAY